MLFMVGGLIITSCENSNSDDMEETLIGSLSEDETIALVESDDISDEIDNVVEDFLSEELDGLSKEEASKSGEKTIGGRPDCVTRTIVENGNMKSVTLDFAENCTLPNGHVLTGQIILTYEKDDDSKTKMITKTFNNFSFNNVTVEGENIIVRTRKNENGNPQSIKTIDVLHTWPDGESISKKGTKTREWVEGYETKTWGDNVFLITGNWSSSFKDGRVCSANIDLALRREMACRFIVSGIIQIDKGLISGELNYGDGTCDNLAVFTDNEGNETERILRERKRHK